jgi:hypothetical protein
VSRFLKMRVVTDRSSLWICRSRARLRGCRRISTPGRRSRLSNW